MDVHVKLSRTGEPWKTRPHATNSKTEEEILEMATRDSTLERLFESLSKSHPELAPILEDATDQPDVEIRVNDAPIHEQAADTVRLRDGDTVSLLIHEP